MATESAAGDAETVLKTLNGQRYMGGLNRLVFRMTTGYSRVSPFVSTHLGEFDAKLCIVIPSTGSVDAQGRVTFEGWVFGSKSSLVAVKVVMNKTRCLDDRELTILKKAFITGSRNFAGLPAELTRVDIPL